MVLLIRIIFFRQDVNNLISLLRSMARHSQTQQDPHWLALIWVTYCVAMLTPVALQQSLQQSIKCIFVCVKLWAIMLVIVEKHWYCQGEIYLIWGTLVVDCLLAPLRFPDLSMSWCFLIFWFQDVFKSYHESYQKFFLAVKFEICFGYIFHANLNCFIRPF